MPATEGHFDVIMVGGGVMGCATAHYLLKANPDLKVVIVEMDPTYEKSSSALSDGNTRIQFNIKENIQMSLYGLEVMENFSEEMAVGEKKPEIAFRQQGNLFLVDEESHAEAREGLELQQSLGCQVEWLSPDAIGSRYPLIDPVNCVGGTFGPLDGVLDPYAVLIAYKDKAISMGAQFITAEVMDLMHENKRVKGVKLASGDELLATTLVNSAGAWATELAKTAGIDLPVSPVMRQVFVVETEIHSDDLLPAFFSPSGLYCIHEGENHFMVGKSLQEDPMGFEFSWSRRRFTDILWPELVEFVPSFDRLKVLRGWAGLYAVNTLDGNAILGEWPKLSGIFLANGFSGHGFQQCHAVGRYIAELILDNTPSLDLSVFSPQRILANEPVFESKRKLI
jgi:FAD-dependent oxidoreductase domain-containing protein 1